MMKRQLCALVTGALILTSGCSQSQHNHKQVTLSLPTEAKAAKLDAQGYDAAMPVYSAVYDALVQYDKKKTFKPGLAQKWEVEDGGKTYRFHLKKGVKFSDGSDFDAQAVKFSIERAKAMNKETTVETLKQLKSVVVKNKHTVEINLKTPSNQVLNELTQVRPLRIMSPHAVKDGKVTGQFKEAIGTGAFKIGDAGKEKTTLKPNPYFKGNKPLNYDLVFQTIEDGDARQSAIQSGAVDITGGALGMLTDAQIKQAKSTQKLSVSENPSTVSHFIAFNPENKQLQHKDLRQAISESIQTKALSSQPLKGLFQRDVQYVTAQNQQQHRFDKKAAQHAFEQAGYHRNKQGMYEKDGQVLTFNLVIQTAEFPNWKDKAEQVQANLKAVGVKVNIKHLDAQSYYDTLWTKKDYDLIFYRTYSDALMPYNFMNSVFKNNGDKPGVLANDKVLTQQLEAFPKEIDKQSQKKAFNHIFKHFNQQYYGVPIAYPNETFITSDKIKSFKFSGLTDAPVDYKKLEVNQ